MRNSKYFYDFIDIINFYASQSHINLIILTGPLSDKTFEM